MRYLWIVVAAIVICILTCNMRHAEKWVAQQPVSQIQVAIDLLQSNPTAAGGKK